MRMVNTLDQPPPDPLDVTPPLWTYDPRLPHLHTYPVNKVHIGEARQYLGCFYISDQESVVCRIFAYGKGLEVYQTGIPALEDQWSLGALTLISQQYASTRQTWKLRVMNMEPIDFRPEFANPISPLLSDKLIVVDVKEMNRHGRERVSAVEFDEISGRLFFISHDRIQGLHIGILDSV